MSIFQDIFESTIAGLQILSKYPGGQISAEHDVIYAGPGDPKEVSPEDAKALEDLGWHIDTEVDVWARFV